MQNVQAVKYCAGLIVVALFTVGWFAAAVWVVATQGRLWGYAALGSFFFLGPPTLMLAMSVVSSFKNSDEDSER